MAAHHMAIAGREQLRTMSLTGSALAVLVDWSSSITYCASAQRLVRLAVYTGAVVLPDPFSEEAAQGEEVARLCSLAHAKRSGVSCSVTQEVMDRMGDADAQAGSTWVGAMRRGVQRFLALLQEVRLASGQVAEGPNARGPRPAQERRTRRAAEPDLCLIRVESAQG